MLVVRAARLFDPGMTSVLSAPALLIEDGRIVAVHQGEIGTPEGAEVLDLGDVTLLPGLIDVHVHLGFDAGPDPVRQMLADDDHTLLLRMAHFARQALQGGVTTVRDLGDRHFLGLILRDWYRSGAEVGPEIIAAGPPVTPTGGHCWFMGGEADGELEIRRGVRARVKRGVDVIKVMATGGNMTPGTNPMEAQFTVEELAAAVQEAHRLGRKVTAHAHGAPGIARAIEAAVDGIEHCSFQTPTGIHADDRLIAALASSQIAVCPTVGRPATGLPDPPEWVARNQARMEALARMHRAGVRLVGGTDAGIRGVPHDSVRHCIEVYTRIGMTNAQAIAAATAGGAEACGTGDRKGRLTAGYDADILAVAGDPLQDITRIHHVAAVFRAGQRVC